MSNDADVLSRVAQDLAASGLTIDDVKARPITNSERAATNTPATISGYVIPYLNIFGKAVPFYRVKLFDFDPKYKQPKETPNHVYYPRNFFEVAETSKYVFITEGEKKAALATKLGFPTVAFGGVESWRNRIISFSADAELSTSGKRMNAKLPAGAEITEDMTSPLALGLQELIDFVLRNHKTVIIVYDSDSKHGTNTNVQRAAAHLGFELRFRGVPFTHVRQILLPLPDGFEKIGLDDFLTSPLGASFSTLVDACMAKRSAFPRHPAIRDYLNKRLQKPKLSRKELQAISLAIVSELDANGLRLKSRLEQRSYYFDQRSHKLIRAALPQNLNESAEGAFSQHLYKNFGIGTADQRVLQWFLTQFNGEEPIGEVSPFRIYARPDVNRDSVIMQISDGAYVEVDAEGMRIKPNGSEGVLFEAESVLPIDIDKLKAEWNRQSSEVLTNWWMEVMRDVRLKDKDKMRVVAALLFYIAPWLHRWRGTQLPIEMTIGEAGSGKSTLQELRLMIQTGEPRLRNSPQDLKDWNASIANSGGLHVTDNVQLLDRSLRQKLSDEICRIITEPNPSIEMRKYYTEADLIRIPVRCVFGITAIQQPFQNSDILQRSVIIELDKAQDLKDGVLAYDMNWKNQQLSRFGGREAWLAHHLLVLHKFFQIVRQKWDRKYLAKHRLINFEQIMLLMGQVFNLPVAWIPEYLSSATEKSVTETDWCFEGLIAFADFWRTQAKNAQGELPLVIAQNISDWALSTEEFATCEALVNSRRLGRYLKTHKTMIATTARIYEAGMTNNRQRYRVLP